MAILIRPVREQFEHDRVIRALELALGERFAVDVNVGDERKVPIKTGTGQAYPDLILSSTDAAKKPVAIVEVETGESVNNLEAMYQWVLLAKARAQFRLYVPVACVDATRRLCAQHAIAPAEVWSYASLGGDQIRLERVFRDAALALRHEPAQYRTPRRHRLGTHPPGQRHRGRGRVGDPEPAPRGLASGGQPPGHCGGGRSGRGRAVAPAAPQAQGLEAQGRQGAPERTPDLEGGAAPAPTTTPSTASSAAVAAVKAAAARAAAAKAAPAAPPLRWPGRPTPAQTAHRSVVPAAARCPRATTTKVAATAVAPGPPPAKAAASATPAPVARPRSRPRPNRPVRSKAAPVAKARVGGQTCRRGCAREAGRDQADRAGEGDRAQGGRSQAGRSEVQARQEVTACQGRAVTRKPASPARAAGKATAAPAPARGKGKPAAKAPVRPAAGKAVASRPAAKKAVAHAGRPAAKATPRPATTSSPARGGAVTRGAKASARPARPSTSATSRYQGQPAGGPSTRRSQERPPRGRSDHREHPLDGQTCAFDAPCFGKQAEAEVAARRVCR